MTTLATWLLVFVTSGLHALLVLSFRRGLGRRHGEARRLLAKRETFDQYLSSYGAPAKDPSARRPDAATVDLFDAYYEPRAYLLPVCLCVLFSGVAIVLGLTRLGAPLAWSGLAQPAATVSAAVYASHAGAYLWGLYDLLRRLAASDLPASALHPIWLRLLVAAPLGEILGRSFREGEALPLLLAFGLGAFPLRSIQEMLFEKVEQGWKVSRGGPESAPNDLHRLQGLTRGMIERLAEERIESVEHLAYSDPLKLLVKTGYEPTRIFDLLDQALLAIYVGPALSKLPPMGIRGAIEAADLHRRLTSPDPAEKRQAASVVTSVAQALSLPAATVRNLLLTVDQDTQVQFLWHLWGSAFEAGEAEQPPPAPTPAPAP